MRTFKRHLEAVTIGTLENWLDTHETFDLFFRKWVTASFSKWNEGWVEIVFHHPGEERPLAFHNPKATKDDIPHLTPMCVLFTFDEIENVMAAAEAYAEKYSAALRASGKSDREIPSEAYKVFEYLYKRKGGR